MPKYHQFGTGFEFFLIEDEEGWNQYREDRDYITDEGRYPKHFEDCQPNFFPCIVLTYGRQASRWQYDEGREYCHNFLYPYELTAMEDKLREVRNANH